MKFYIDTANVDEIRRANDMGIIAGVTTLLPMARRILDNKIGRAHV